MKTYTYQATIQKVPGIDGAFVPFPYDLKTEYGKGRVKVHATFDGVPYEGSIVNMGIKNPDGSICYIIGIRKDIRAAIGKQAGDTITVTITDLLRKVKHQNEKVSSALALAIPSYLKV